VTTQVDSRFYVTNGPFSLIELISELQAELPDPSFSDTEISSAARLKTSQPGDITFFENRKNRAVLETAKATACFVSEKNSALIGERGIVPIITDYPRAHFARSLLKLFKSSSKTSPMRAADNVLNAHKGNIHETALIGENVELGEGVKIGPYVVIGSGVKIGARTHIGAHAVISHCYIGQDCKIKSGAVIGEAGFGIANDEVGVLDIPHIGRVLIEDRVSIGSQTCIDRGQLGDTQIAMDSKIDNFVQIAHNVTIGPRCRIAGHVGISGSCKVGADVMMGGNVGLADHIEIGDGARLAARAGVMHNVPAGETWSGIPAQPIRDHMRMVSAMRKLGDKSTKTKKI